MAKDTQDVVDALSKVDLFAGLPARDLASIAERGRVVSFRAGAEIAEENRTGIGFHLLLSGQADVLVGGQARGTMQAGSYFGEISLIDGRPRSATVRVAEGGATTFALTSWEFDPLLDEHPEIARALLRTLCARLRAAESAGRG